MGVKQRGEATFAWSEAQLREVFDRLDLRRLARPFTRCLSCNAPLRAVDRAEVEDRLPPAVRERYRRFATCDGRGRWFWEGTHWRRMAALVDSLKTAGPDGGAGPRPGSVGPVGVADDRSGERSGDRSGD